MNQDLHRNNKLQKLKKKSNKLIIPKIKNKNSNLMMHNTNFHKMRNHLRFVKDKKLHRNMQFYLKTFENRLYIF